MKNKKENKGTITEMLLTCEQACNWFKLSGRDRRVMLVKYNGVFISESNWRELFKQENMIKG